MGERISPEHAEGAPQGGLSPQERESIELLADARRRGSEFKQAVLHLEVPEGEALQARHNRMRDLVMQEAAREQPSAVAPTESYDQLTAEGDETATRTPNLAALKYVRAAEIREASNEDPRTSLDRAKEMSRRAAELPRTNPSSLLADAKILGIEQRVLKNRPLPSPETVAHGVPSQALLEDYALVLADEDRNRFLGLLPAEQRAEASAVMDRALSAVLKEPVVTEKERGTKHGLQERTREALGEAVRVPETVSKKVVKLLSETLVELNDEDSKRLLRDAAKEAVAGKTSKEKISYAARMVRELAKADITKGGNVAMKFLARKEIPPRLFTYFSKMLVREDYITKNAKTYLEDQVHIPWLRKLIAEYPNQFNTVVDTITQIKGYNPAERSDEIFSALEDLDSLTPIIFDRYRKADAPGKKELAQNIRELKPKLFQNTPIKNILRGEDRTILAEMVYLAYKPVGMSFEKVQALINQLKDQTDDLAAFQFPPEGYEFSLEQSERVKLRPGERIDPARLQSSRDLFTGEYPKDEQEVKSLSALLGRLAKAGTNLKSDELTRLMSVMSRDEMVQNFLKRNARPSEETAYNYLAEVKEILGIYFKDNYKERLANFLGANPTTEGQLAKLLTNPERQQTLKKQLGREADDIHWDRLNERGEVARLLTRVLDTKLLRPIRESVNKDLSKFQREGGEKATAGQKNLRAYISKNVGSFFAKASAGICTAADIPLFNRDDHFHINVVEGDQYVRANIQAYIIKDGKERSLVLRGFNPNTDFVDKIDVANFSEKTLDIGRRFVSDNKLSALYITEQGGWHALSNRDRVAAYLTKKYQREDRRKDYTLPVSSGHSVSSLYKI